MRRPNLVRFLVFAAALGSLAAALVLAPDNVLLTRASWFAAGIAALPALTLGRRGAAIYLAACALLAAAVQALNAGKISLIEMPLTYLDLRIATANPAGFLGAMKISPTAAFGLLGAVALIAAAALLRRLSRIDAARLRRAAAPRLAAFAVAMGLAGAATTLFAQRLETAIQGHEYADIANMPDGLLLISRLIGPVPFLALTARYDASSASPFRDLAGLDTAHAAPAPEAPAAFLAPFAAPPAQPDVVVVLLESTFDLPKVFDVAPPVTSPLFPRAGLGQLQGELSVNAIGGGTWISEFEAITGVPSRLFGYAGYYTHVELAPYVRGSLATWFEARGYATLGLYPVEGKFYGARAAYGHYGFDRFVDGEELKIDKPWYAQDTDIVEKYIGVIDGADRNKPLFAFALTMENHSPHPCTRFGDEREMPYRFVGPTNTRGTCELNEYVARFRSTETAVAMLEQALRKRQAETGRPYVLALFGDHQPNTFTGTGKAAFWSPNDYSALRRAPNDTTFYQIRSSAPSPFATRTLDTSVVMLPTLVSAYAARNPRDLYLPANLGIQAGCGGKIALPRLNEAYGKDAVIQKGQLGASALAVSCGRALVAARPDYLSLIAMP